MELERGNAVYTFGEPAQLRKELGIPTYAVSNPGPLLGYAIRKLPNGKYAEIYVCRSTAQQGDGGPLEAAPVPGAEETLRQSDEEIVQAQIERWQATSFASVQSTSASAEGPGNAWLFGQWVRWVFPMVYYPPAYALLDFSLYQLSDNQPRSDFYLCDVRIETMGGGFPGVGASIATTGTGRSPT